MTITGVAPTRHGAMGIIMECLAYVEQAWERLRAPAEGCASAKPIFLFIPREARLLEE
ncbi:hypothetical protein ACMHYB_13485 [Sorangium sp. So ce1128]